MTTKTKCSRCDQTLPSFGPLLTFNVCCGTTMCLACVSAAQHPRIDPTMNPTMDHTSTVATSTRSCCACGLVPPEPGTPEEIESLKQLATTSRFASDLLGNRYEKAGLFCRALNYWEHAAHAGYAPAMLSLGLCYARGRIGNVRIEQSNQVAFNWLHKAAILGHQCAIENMLILLARDDQGIDQGNNVVVSNEIHSSNNCALCAYPLPLDCVFKLCCGEGVHTFCEKNKSKEEEQSKRRRRLSTSSLCCNCGEKPPNAKNELRLLHKWCKTKKPWAIGLLAERYEKGEGVKQSHEKALEYYEQAAHLGDALAMFHLSTLLMDDAPRVARDWMKKSAAYGVEEALGFLKHMDDPTSVDDPNALDFCTSCSRQSNDLKSCACNAAAFCNASCKRAGWNEHKQLHRSLCDDFVNDEMKKPNMDGFLPDAKQNSDDEQLCGLCQKTLPNNETIITRAWCCGIGSHDSCTKALILAKLKEPKRCPFCNAKTTKANQMST